MLGYNFTFESEVTEGDKGEELLDFQQLISICRMDLSCLNSVFMKVERLLTIVTYKSFTNIGMRPTWRVEKALSETHIFDFSGDLYGKTIAVELIDYLRPEKHLRMLMN